MAWSDYIRHEGIGVKGYLKIEDSVYHSTVYNSQDMEAT